MHELDTDARRGACVIQVSSMRLQVRSLVSLLPALFFILVVFSEHVSAELFVFPSGTLTLEQCSQVDLSWQPEQVRVLHRLQDRTKPS